jgi:uncharacterized protein (TIGR00251 family)
MKLLLADDDADQLELRSMTLGNAGYDICIAGDVPTALRMASEQSPEAAVVDLRMPTQDLGLQLIRGLKQLNSRLRVIVLTGIDPRQFEKLPERALVEAVFTKGGASKLLLQYLKDSQGFELRRRLASDGQLVLDVKVIPRSSKSEIVEFMPDGSLKVKLAAVPEKGKANEELIQVLAAYFDVRKDAIELLTGETSQRKRVRIHAAKAASR